MGLHVYSCKSYENDSVFLRTLTLTKSLVVSCSSTAVNRITAVHIFGMDVFFLPRETSLVINAAIGMCNSLAVFGGYHH